MSGSGSIETDHGFPRKPLWGAAALVIFSVLVCTLGRLSGVTDVPRDGIRLAIRDLHFVDRPDGGINVVDARTRRLVDIVIGESGFLRGTVRGLASQRKRADLDLDTPFRLTAWQDGRLTLDDPTNGRHVELEAFGTTNEAVFAQLIAKPEISPIGDAK